MNHKPFLFFAAFSFVLAGMFKPVCGYSQSIPPFQITLSNNKAFNAKDLPKEKPVIIIYFDPGCEHCQKLMSELFKKIDQFKEAQMVMVTFKPVEELPPFEKLHNTKKYPNIKVGTEGLGFYLRDYYGLMKMPFVALYDKKGNLSWSTKEQPSVDDLAQRLHNLK